VSWWNSLETEKYKKFILIGKLDAITKIIHKNEMKFLYIFPPDRI